MPCQVFEDFAVNFVLPEGRTFWRAGSRMSRRELGPNRDKGLDYENSFVHLGRSSPACQPIRPENCHDDLRRNEHV
jgi:hypothetical protein